MKNITVVTTLGARYEFPDMDEGHVSLLLKELDARTTVVFVNYSGASMTIPGRIIKTLSLDGEIVWTSPV